MDRRRPGSIFVRRRGADDGVNAFWGLVGTLVVGLLSALPALGATTIRDDGLLDIDGEVLFPVGLVELGSYVYEDWNELIRESGANLVWDIELAYADTSPSCGAIMD